MGVTLPPDGSRLSKVTLRLLDSRTGEALRSCSCRPVWCLADRAYQPGRAVACLLAPVGIESCPDHREDWEARGFRQLAASEETER